MILYEGIPVILAERDKGAVSIGIEPILEFAGVIVGEVVFIVLHAVEGDGPHLILLILPSQEGRQLLLDAFGGVVEEDHGIIEDCALVGGHVGVDAIYVPEFLHEELLVLAERRAGEALPVGDLIERVVVAQRIVVSKLDAVHLDALAATDPLAVERAVDHLLPDGDEVQPRAEEARVLRLAVLAGVDFEFVHKVLRLVPQEAEVLIVAAALPQGLDQAVVGQSVDDGVLHGLDLEGGPAVGDELEAQQERRLPLRHRDLVDHVSVIVGAQFPAAVPHASLLEDLQAHVALDVYDELFGVRDADLDGLGERLDGLVCEVGEEEDLLEDALVGLLEVVLLEDAREGVDEAVFLLDVELLLDVVRLLDVVADAQGEFRGDAVLLGETAKDLVLLALLEVLAADVADQRPHAVDVVGQHHAAERLDHDQAQCLLVVARRDVPETHRQHDVYRPVVGPDVRLEPGGVVDSLHRHPVLLRADVGDRPEDEGEEVGEAEVEEENLDERPVLFLVGGGNEVYLNLLQFLKQVGQLEHDHQLHVLDGSPVGKELGSHQHDHAQVDQQAFLHVAPDDLLQFRYQLARDALGCHHSQQELRHEDQQRPPREVDCGLQLGDVEGESEGVEEDAEEVDSQEEDVQTALQRLIDNYAGEVQPLRTVVSLLHALHFYRRGEGIIS